MKFLWLTLTIFCFQLTYSQDLPNFEAITLDKASDYKPAESSVLTAANYVFSVSVNDDNASRRNALAFIIRWMSGTPDYNFELDETAAKVCKGSDAMMGLYVAAMTKYALEHPANAKDSQLVKDNTIDMLIQYCQKPENNLKMTKGLKKYKEEREKQKA
jgi:hypothetical protein